MSSPTPSIVLIGMMGAGKSSVGRLLARRTGLARFDTDEWIVSKTGMSIADIFEREGETGFRELETSALNELHPAGSAVIVTGGGIVLREENVKLLKRLGFVVWLEAEEDILLERASRVGNRPLLQTENPRGSLSEMLRVRAPLYAGAADFRVETTYLKQDEVTEIILAEVDRRTGAPA